MSKKTLAVFVFVVTLLFSSATLTHAALTTNQVNAIIGLLQSFGADQGVVDNVRVSLTGGTPTTTTATSSAPSCTPVGLKYNLYLGVKDNETGGDVTKLQRFLAQDTSVYPAGLVTGFFGPMTELAVQKWQAKNNVVSSGAPDTTGYGVVGPKTRGRMIGVCGGTSLVPVVVTPVSPTVPPVVTPTQPTVSQPVVSTPAVVYFSTTFVDYAYTIGNSVNGFEYQSQIILTNGSKENVYIRIVVNNQPSWLNTAYSKDLLTISPGQPLGIGVSVNPVGLTAGTYKTEISVEGNFAGSPKVIPITLRVYGSVPIEQSLNITNPLGGHVWTFGDTQTFRWTTTGVASSVIGYIDLVNNYGTTYRINNVPNTGSYTWTDVGTINGSVISAGTSYSAKIIMDVGDISAPFTIKEKQSLPISINANYSMTGFDGQYKKYVLNLSGGATTNPVKWWTLNFICPSNVSEVIAKISGNVCDGVDYKLGNENDEAGSIEIPLDILNTDNNVSELKIHVKATGKDDGIMGEIDFIVGINKG